MTAPFEASGRDPWIDPDVQADLQSVSVRLNRVEAACRGSKDGRVRKVAWTAAHLRMRAEAMMRRLARIAARPPGSASAPGPSGRVQPLVKLGPGGDFHTDLVPRGSHLDVVG